MRKTSVFRYLLLLPFAILSIISSCKKQNIPIKNSTETSFFQQNHASIEHSKQWYEKNVDRTNSNPFSSMEPNWNSVFIKEDSTQQILEFMLNNPDKVVQTEQAVAIDNPTSYLERNSIRLIVIKDKNTSEIRTSYYMSVLNNGEVINLNTIHYKQVDKLSGRILFYNINGAFINGWTYQKGVTLNKLSPKIKQSNLVGSGNRNRIMNYDSGGGCSTIEIPTYREVCVGVEGFMNCEWVQNGSVPINTICIDDNVGDGGASGGIGGGGSGSPTKIDLNWLDRTKYPVLGKIVDGLYEKVKTDKKLMEALKTYSKLSEEKILSSLVSGQGPKLQVVSNLPGNVVGRYIDGTNEIKISEDDAKDLNNFDMNQNVSTALEFFFTSLILHEFVHFGNDITGEQVASIGQFDAGAQFENVYYRGDVKYDPVTKDIFLVPLPK